VPWQAAYPTPEHRNAALAIVEHFASGPVEAVLLTNSCARGKATPDSCLDMAVLIRPGLPRADRLGLDQSWEAYCETDEVFRALRSAGQYSEVHLNIVEGAFAPEPRDEAAGPDGFELEIGNLLVYSQPLLVSGDYLDHLKQQWLPYYAESLRRERLERVRWYCLNNLHHIPGYVARGLHFQAFDRLYNAYREFLQALFMARRTYPIAYNKWIREQVVDVLALPDLYSQLTHLFEIRHFEGAELIERGKAVERLLETYAPAPDA